MARKLEQTTVIVTRSKEDSLGLVTALEKHGARVYEFPVIEFMENSSLTLSDILIDGKTATDSFDLLIFTSRQAVRFFVKLLKSTYTGSLLSKNIDAWKRIPVTAVGAETAKILSDNGFIVSLTPEIFTSNSLARELGNIRGKKILVPRSQLADEGLIRDLVSAGAIVTPFRLYTTKFIGGRDEKLKKILTNRNNDVYCTFTSPSTVRGFTKRFEGDTLTFVRETVRVVCIGPVTELVARKEGFRNIVTAGRHTSAGIVEAILESFS